MVVEKKRVNLLVYLNTWDSHNVVHSECGQVWSLFLIDWFRIESFHFVNVSWRIHIWIGWIHWIQHISKLYCNALNMDSAMYIYSAGFDPKAQQKNGIPFPRYWPSEPKSVIQTLQTNIQILYNLLRWWMALRDLAIKYFIHSQRDVIIIIMFVFVYVESLCVLFVALITPIKIIIIDGI